MRSTPQIGLALVLAIVGWQSIEVTESFIHALSSPLWILPHVAWPASLFVCGYGVARLVDDESRLRVMPRLLAFALLPLVFTILGTAFFLGPAVTSNSLSDYFTAIDLWNYLRNLLGWPQFALPGVFEFNNVAEVVNEALWALPSFIITVLVALLGTNHRSRAIVALVVAAGLVAADFIVWLGFLSAGSGMLVPALAAALAGQLGVLASQPGSKLRGGLAPIAVSGVGLLILAYIGRGGNQAGPIALLLIAILASVAVDTASAWRLPLGQFGASAIPYLAGALMVAFPIQQLIVSWFPSQGPISNFLVALPPIAVASIAVVELSKRLVLMFDSTAPAPMTLSALMHLRAPSLAMRRRRLSFSPLVLVYSALVVAAIGALAMTLFALHREPWEN